MSVPELDIAPRTRGRAAGPLSVQHVRDLEVGDLALLASERSTAPPMIAKLRDRHHALAKCLAMGMTNAEASIQTGYDPSRISILKNDPSFKALLEDYRALADGAQADFFSRTNTLAISTVNRLQDLVDDDEELSPSVLLEIGKFAADRSGNAPVTKSVNVNVNHQFGDKLKAARERAQRAALEAPAIDAEFSAVEDPGG